MNLKSFTAKNRAENVSWISWLGLALTSLVSVFGLGIREKKIIQSKNHRKSDGFFIYKYKY